MNSCYELSSGGAVEVFAATERGAALGRAVERSRLSPIRVILRQVDFEDTTRKSSVVFDSDAPAYPFRTPRRERPSSLSSL